MPSSTRVLISPQHLVTHSDYLVAPKSQCHRDAAHSSVAGRESLWTSMQVHRLEATPLVPAARCSAALSSLRQCQVLLAGPGAGRVHTGFGKQFPSPAPRQHQESTARGGTKRRPAVPSVFSPALQLPTPLNGPGAGTEAQTQMRGQEDISCSPKIRGVAQEPCPVDTGLPHYGNQCVFPLQTKEAVLTRRILESSSYLISVCGLLLRQGPRFALRSLRDKGGKWNKTETPSWGGRRFSAGHSFLIKPWGLITAESGAGGRGKEVKLDGRS